MDIRTLPKLPLKENNAAWIANNYTLWDKFTTDRAAGAINGTSAEDVGGTRTVLDTNNKFSISGGSLVMATGAVANDYITWMQLARVPGQTLKSEISMTTAAITIGLDNTLGGSVTDGITFGGSSSLYITEGATAKIIGTWGAGTYQLAVTQRAIGAFYFIKGGSFTNWTLLYVSPVSGSLQYPVITFNSVAGVGSVSEILIPKKRYIPTPLVSDGFSSSTTDGKGNAEQNGPTGGTWTGSTWTNTEGTAVNTPVTLGADLITNGGFEGSYTAGLAPNWLTITGTPTESADAHGGSKAQQFQATSLAGRLYQDIPTTNHRYYRMSAWVKRVSGTAGDVFTGISNGVTESLTDAVTSSTYTQVFVSERARGATMNIRPLRGATNAVTDVCVVDDVTVQELTLSELMRTTESSATDFVITAQTSNLPRGLHFGIVANVDDPSNPRNFVLFVQEGNAVRLLKCVAGVFTEVGGAVVAKNNTAVMTLIKRGTSYWGIYNTNNGSTSTATISDAGIVSNTKHGLFSTHPSITVDNFVIWPSGTLGNEHSVLDSL